MLSEKNPFEGIIMMPPKTPVLDRVSALRSESSILGNFLDWLHENHAEDQVLDLNPQTVLEAYFEVDADEMEKERREVLAYQRILLSRDNIRKELGLKEGE